MEGIILSEICQTAKDQYSIISYVEVKKREREIRYVVARGGERSPNSAQEERRGVGLWKPERTEWVPLKAENTGALLLGGAAGGQGCETRAS